MTTSAATTTAPYAELAAVVRGDLIVPGDPGYDQARAVYNAMIDKYPAAIARCRDTADVIACVRFAGEHGLAIAVRGGGHNAAGLGVADDALVIAYRDGGWAGVIVGVDPDPANADRISQWAQDYWEELHPTSAGGAYINFMMDEGQDRVKASYRGNYDRLTRVKDRYDPANTFHINQNIQPASQSNP